LQSTTPTIVTGNLAVSLSGRGLVHNSIASIQGDASGQIEFGVATTAANAGMLDINKFNAVFASDPINAATSSITAPATLGRGTAVVNAMNPNVTYNIVYYLVNSNTAVVFDSDTTRNMTGFILQQF
jgi:hypothetical protein